MTTLASAEGLGYAAALLTTASFVPQVLHTLRTRDVAGISVGMYSVFTTGVALWLAYGVMIHAWPVIIANLITLLLAAWILGLKLVLQRRQRPDQNRKFKPIE
jgi:MtN3 and saliva related transmembrane protein